MAKPIPSNRPKWKQWLYDTIFGIDTVGGRLFDIGLLIAILFSLIVIMLESVKSIDARFGKEIDIIELCLTGLFTIEYIARIVASPHPKKYIFDQNFL